MTDQPDAWSAATYDGAELRLRRSVAGATPLRRLEWLEEALQLALVSGALGRARRRKQLECERAWNAGASPPA